MSTQDETKNDPEEPAWFAEFLENCAGAYCGELYSSGPVDIGWNWYEDRKDYGCEDDPCWRCWMYSVPFELPDGDRGLPIPLDLSIMRIVRLFDGGGDNIHIYLSSHDYDEKGQPVINFEGSVNGQRVILEAYYTCLDDVEPTHRIKIVPGEGVHFVEIAIGRVDPTDRD